MSHLIVSKGTAIVSAVSFVFIESANPEDMQAKAQAVVDQLISGARTGGIAAWELAAAGDGHAFMLRFVIDSNLAAPDAGTTVRCYMAVAEDTIALAAAAALATVAQTDVYVSDALAGCSQGRHWMGMIVTAPPQI